MAFTQGQFQDTARYSNPYVPVVFLEYLVNSFGIVMANSIIQLCRYWFRWWLVAWQHPANTWANAVQSSLRSFGIHLRTIFQEMVYSWHEFENYSYKITAASPRVKGFMISIPSHWCIWLVYSTLCRISHFYNGVQM